MKALSLTAYILSLKETVQASKLPCSAPPKRGTRPVERVHHPNACCGTNPYDRETKGCCKVVSRDIPVVFTKMYQDCCGGHIIDKQGQGCCKNKPFNLESNDCCDGDITDASIFPGCRCEFTDWTEWGSCAASLGGGFQERKRNWKVKDGMTGDMCPTRPRHPDYTLQERRDGSPDGQINCLQNTAMSLSNGLKNAGKYKDLIILLDESTSIKPDNFEHAKQLVNNIVKSLCGGVGRYSNRVSVVRFSADVKIDIPFNETMTTEDVVNQVSQFKYSPVESKNYKGSTYTAAAMKEVYEKVISKSNGWRMGSGPATCSGVIIDGTCYWIPKSYVSASQIDETCQAGMNGGQPAVLDTENKYFMVSKLVERTFGFPENDDEREGPWAGINVLRNGEWEYYNDGSKVKDWLVDVNQPEGCVQFAYQQQNGREYELRTSDDCDRQRRVICQQSPLSYLDVETELLLITDGRSNDPRDFGITIEEMKDLYSKTEINVSAIGVGRINEQEIRGLTDDQGRSGEEGHIFYLMSWESVQKFNRIFEKVSNKFDQMACLPLSVSGEDIAWLKWKRALEGHGVLKKNEDEENTSPNVNFFNLSGF